MPISKLPGRLRFGQGLDTVFRALVFASQIHVENAGGHKLAERAIDRIDLERALAELPEGCRAAFVLHDVEGLEHKEVSEVLGIAEGTSKSQVFKARNRLRGLLK